MTAQLFTEHNIRVTCIQPGAVATELYDHISDAGYRKQMDDLASSMVFMQSSDIAETVLFAAKAPRHVDVAELFAMPTQQGWCPPLRRDRPAGRAVRLDLRSSPSAHPKRGALHAGPRSRGSVLPRRR